jgi:hypothetical protein
LLALRLEFHQQALVDVAAAVRHDRREESCFRVP